MSLLATTAERRGDVALDDGSNQIGWPELRARVTEVAAALSSLAETGQPLAYRLDHGAAATLIDLALFEAGIASLPLPFFFTPEQQDHALRAAGCAALLSHGWTSGVLLQAGFSDIMVERLPYPAVSLPEGTARISFTSGSTGTPKGICLSAGHLRAVAETVVARVGLRHAGRHLPVLPPGILLENVAGLYATLLAGGAYVALGQAEIGFANPFRPDFGRLVEAIIAHRITSLILVPEYLAGLVTALEATGRRLPDLTLVAVGGARTSPSLLERAAAVRLPVRQGYGLTECASVVALEAESETAHGSVGTSLGVNRISLAEDGEVLIGGPLHLGTTDGAAPPELLQTGDIGRFDEAGRLWIEGRKSNLIVTSFGRNISPEWIEGALAEQPAILQAMVRGDGEAALEALLVPARPDADLSAGVAAANATLPAYARIETWRAVPPFLPSNGMLTGNGRLRRQAIEAAYPRSNAGLPFFQRLVDETREAQARFAAVPQLQAGLTGRISRADYIAYLTQAYHHVRHTVPLMEEARARLGHRPLLVEALDDYIEEERGHEAWVLGDIQAAGGDPIAAAAGPPAPATQMMVDHAYEVIRNGNPAAFFGMVYVLEGTSIALASSGAAAVQRSLGLPESAFRYLTSHGALDQQHMQFFEDLMNRIDDPDDQAAIVAMARDMFGLFGGLFASIELEGAREAA